MINKCINFTKKIIKNKELRNATLFTLLCLFVFRIGSNIVISSVDVSSINQIGGFEIFNLLTGADMTGFTIFALGLSPFITGSIVVELLSNDVIPAFTRWKKENDTHKRNVASNTIGLVTAFLQATSITLALDNTYGIMRAGNIYSYIYTIAIMVAGSCFLLWMSKQIDSYGIGNGSSLIIAAGILYKMPSMIDVAYNIVVTYKDWTTFVSFGLLMLAFLSVVFFVVFIEKSERRIPIVFSQGKNSVLHQKSLNEYLPIKVNASGVIPVIFASSILQIPSMLAMLTGKNPNWINYFSFSHPIGIGIYALMIVFFVFYYSHTLINAKNIDKNFKQSRCNINGVRPGEETEKYINKVLNRVCSIGAIALLFIALIPILLPMFWNTAYIAGLTVGGTSLIIVTSVTLEIYNKFKSQMTRKEYTAQSMFWKK